ncbi:MAG: hypothetical protein EXR72_09930, partial [Myxococcales bacterium]|nr:hypothetical protein [Myxococcales bacterium]
MRRPGLVALLALLASGDAGAGTPPTPLAALPEAPSRTTRPTPVAAVLALAPRLIVDLRADEAGPARPATLVPPAWRQAARSDGGITLESELDDPALGLHARLRIERDPADAAATLTVDVEHRQAHWAHRVVLDLDLPGPATVLDRALQKRPVTAIAFLDRFAAKELRAGDLTLLVDDGIDGVVITPGATRSTARVELFAVEERPFSHNTRCTLAWRTPNGRIDSQVRLRLPGDRDHARIQVALGTGPALAKARYPDGRSAALVISDHADQTSPTTLAALARGRSNAAKPEGGLLGHRLTITKSLFFHGDDR